MRATRPALVLRYKTPSEVSARGGGSSGTRTAAASCQKFKAKGGGEIRSPARLCRQPRRWADDGYPVVTPQKRLSLRCPEVGSAEILSILASFGGKVAMKANHRLPPLRSLVVDLENDNVLYHSLF